MLIGTIQILILLGTIPGINAPWNHLIYYAHLEATLVTEKNLTKKTIGFNLTQTTNLIKTRIHHRRLLLGGDGAAGADRDQGGGRERLDGTSAQLRWWGRSQDYSDLF